MTVLFIFISLLRKTKKKGMDTLIPRFDFEGFLLYSIVFGTFMIKKKIPSCCNCDIEGGRRQDRYSSCTCSNLCHQY
jgi:hypothetical protein